ncbi:flavodoxin family protein [Eubacteriales bacterium OttesenSCG-928-N13]|nr:flavodoxin family protein [Eubacteriales bacterium OttesenSCG-928-N13]
MSKRIFILNGSPRAHGNTETLAAAFAEGAQSAGRTVTNLNLRTMNINPCLGCYQCRAKKGTPCVQRDEMSKVYDAFAQADAVVLASPLYFWSFSAQLKTAIDRLVAPLEMSEYTIPAKDCFMLIAAGAEGDDNFASVVHLYHSFNSQLGWVDKGMLLAGGVDQVGDVQKTDFVQQARDLGASYA